MKAYNRKKGTLTVAQRQVLKQCVVEEFAKQYHIAWDESIFVDVEEV